MRFPDRLVLSVVCVMVPVALGMFAGSAEAGIISRGVQAGVNSTDWLSAGDATLGGQTTGFDWTVSAQGNVAFYSSGSQGIFGSTTEWPVVGTQSVSGYALGYTVGVTNLSDATSLLISAVAPSAGEYSLIQYQNSAQAYIEYATAAGQILQWVATDPSTTSQYSVVASTDGVNNYGAVGAVGFSAVPEPASLALLGSGLLGFAALRRRKPLS